ncbi:MAG: single-stranded DNA-binding protein [Saprospiraceae bacterium]|nr:single-stranded DNA-binding protein [Saprospiraceae bacterium]
MATNCKIELNGFLGADPKSISKNGKTFIALRVATTDSYPVKDEKTGEIKWKDKETVWHDVLVFRPNAAHFARDLKKGDAVTISASLGYKTFKDESGNTKRQASIIANYLEKVEYNRQDELSFDEINTAISQAA